MRQDEEWLVPREVARMLRVNLGTVYRWILSGKLAAYRCGPSRYRVRREDALALLAPVHGESVQSPAAGEKEYERELERLRTLGVDV
jgi:excisionase family DNA binding protein